MTEKEYQKLKYPDSLSDEFLDYLRINNNLIFEDYHWLVIENCKYHTEENPHYTAFLKVGEIDENSFGRLWVVIYFLKLEDWYMYVNEKKDRSINRFHVHFRLKKTE